MYFLNLKKILSVVIGVEAFLLLLSYCVAVDAADRIRVDGEHPVNSVHQSKLLLAKKKKTPLPPVARAEPYDLKGIKLGCTLEGFRASSPFKDVPKPDSGNTSCLEISKTRLFEVSKDGFPFTIATIEPNFLWFHFVNKNGTLLLYKIRAEFLTEQANTILDGLVERYGKPATLERIAKRNAVGAEFQSRDAAWDNELSQIYFREIAGQVGKGDLVYIHKELENAGLEPSGGSKFGGGKDL